MADPTLAAGQYSIGQAGSSSAFVYGGTAASGYANNILVSNTATDTGTVNVQDQAIVGQDGTQFGIDTLPGMVVTQQGQAYSPGSGRHGPGRLQRAVGGMERTAVPARRRGGAGAPRLLPGVQRGPPHLRARPEDPPHLRDGQPGPGPFHGAVPVRGQHVVRGRAVVPDPHVGAVVPGDAHASVDTAAAARRPRRTTSSQPWSTRAACRPGRSSRSTGPSPIRA